MQVSISRSGGITGRTVRTVLDSAALGPDAQQQLRARLESSGLEPGAAAALPAPAGPPRGADLFSYEVTVEDEDRSQTLRGTDADLTPEQRDLVRWVLAAPERSVQRPG